MARSQGIVAARRHALQIEREAALRAKERMFVVTPDEWPRWPILPLVMRNSSDPNDVGFLFAGEESRVYVGNIYGLNAETDLSTYKRIDYASFDDLLEIWRVD